MKGSCRSTVAMTSELDRRRRGSRRWQHCHVRSVQPETLQGFVGCRIRSPELGEVLGVSRLRHHADSLAAIRPSGLPSDHQAGSLGQALAGSLLFWRERRVRWAPAAPVVAPGLRPRFLSVLPKPANFRSR